MKRGLIIISAIPILIVIGVGLVIVLGYTAITHVAAVNITTMLTDLPINTWTNVSVVDWVQRIVIGGEHLSVGIEFEFLP